MRKLLKFLIIIVAIIFIILLAFYILNNRKTFTLTGTVVKVNEKDMIVLSKTLLESDRSWKVSFSDEGDIGFKQGQEVKVYYTDTILDEDGLQNVKKIEIIKDDSGVELSDELLSHYNNSMDKISFNVEEFTKNGMLLLITDTNDIPFVYTNEYKITKKTKNENYTGTGIYTPATNNSTSSFTGTGIEYDYIELDKISDIKIEDTIEELHYNIRKNDGSETIPAIGKKIDWSQFYGKLDEGEYYFTLKVDSTRFNNISISFKISEEGILSYEDPEIDW